MPKTIEKPSPVRKKENEVRREDIELEAYYHWEQRGCPSDDSLTDWVEAERKLAATEHWVLSKN